MSEAPEWVPRAEHEACRQKMLRFRACFHEIIDALDKLSDAEQQDILRHTEPAPLDALKG